MQEAEDKMQKAIESVEKEFLSVRTGRANPALLDKVSADYYGNPTPLKNMANITVSEGRTLVVTPFDKTSLKDIEKAIADSDLDVNPNNDGSVIRITFPPLTEERRKELVKVVKEIAEKYKVSVRNARREALDRNKKDGEATEDDKRKFQDDIQKVTDKHINEIDSLLKNKEEEMLTI